MSRAARYFSRRRGLVDYIAANPLAPVLDDLAGALEEEGYSTAPCRATSGARDTSRTRSRGGNSRDTT